MGCCSCLSGTRDSSWSNRTVGTSAGAASCLNLSLWLSVATSEFVGSLSIYLSANLS